MENLLIEYRDIQVQLELLRETDTLPNSLELRRKVILDNFVNLLSLSDELKDEDIIEAVENELISTFNL